MSDFATDVIGMMKPNTSSHVPDKNQLNPFGAYVQSIARLITLKNWNTISEQYKYAIFKLNQTLMIKEC